jgi:hypothetical protein
VAKPVQRSTERMVRMRYAWRTAGATGRALQWWLQQLEKPATRRALLERHQRA